MGRGNGKTALTAALAMAAFVGPVSQPGAAVIILAASFAQARICFSHLVGFLKATDLYRANPKRFGVSENSRICEILDRQTRCTVRACGSDPRKLHGIAPILVCLDEPSQHAGGTRDALFAAALTSLGKIEGARLIAIGTRSIEALGGFEKLMDTLRQRLAEQKGRHQGGSKWVGTAGTSPFGAYGYNPEGVRIGQSESRH